MSAARVGVIGAGAWGTTLAALIAGVEPVMRARTETSAGCPGSSCLHA
jgi:glycerol-3-phosphate dehydrogenase